MKRDDERIKQLFERSFPAPSEEQTEAACGRVLQRLESLSEGETNVMPAPPPSAPRARIWLAVFGAAAAFAVLALLATPFVRGLLWPAHVYATVLEGSIDQLDGGKILRTNGTTG